MYLYMTDTLTLEPYTFDYIVGTFNLLRGIAAAFYDKPFSAGGASTHNLGLISEIFIPHGIPQTWPGWIIIFVLGAAGNCAFFTAIYGFVCLARWCCDSITKVSHTPFVCESAGPSRV